MVDYSWKRAIGRTQNVWVFVPDEKGKETFNILLRPLKEIAAVVGVSVVCSAK